MEKIKDSGILTAVIRHVSRDKVQPEIWSKKKNPVTNAQIGGGYRTLVQWDTLTPQDIATCFDELKLGEVIKLWIYQKGAQDGSVLSMERTKECDQAMKDNIKELIRRRLYLLDISGFLPYQKYLPAASRKAGNMPEPAIPHDFHRWLLSEAGNLLSGYDVGEQCGRYLGTFAKKYGRQKPAESDYDYYSRQDAAHGRNEGKFRKHLQKNFFRSRREAYLDFRRWLKTFEKGLHNYLTPVTHTNFIHYLCELENTRLIGIEMSLILINHQVALAFMRGAAKQYGLLFWGLPSIFTRWGLSLPADPGQKFRGFSEVGETKGTRPDLVRRIWQIVYMYGASMLGIECGHFAMREKNGRKTPVLTEVGKAHVVCKKWCEQHPDRGVQYTPVGLVLDFYNGWLAPKHGYQFTGEKRLAWNAFPYEKCDHQTDNFFRWVFPGYEEASYHRDGKGFFVPTPFGDIFDVLLSNADARVLKRYNALVLLGNCRISDKLGSRLRDYVREGGEVVLGCHNICAPDKNFFGLRLETGVKSGTKSRTRENEYRESSYVYRKVAVCGAKALLESETGDPLVTVHSYGRGRVIVVTADYWTSKLLEEENGMGLASQKVKQCSPGRKLTLRDKGTFFDERNWDCPYNCIINGMMAKGATLGAIERKVCVHCRVECTNRVEKRCDILNGVKAVLGRYLSSFMPFRIEGAPIHYFANVSDNRKRLVITLANHLSRCWHGGIKFNKSGCRVVSTREWINDRPMKSLDVIEISPKDIRIIEIFTSKALLP